MLTLQNWVVLGIIFIFGSITSIIILITLEDLKSGIISGVATIVLVAIVAGAMIWYNTNTASGQRGLKDFKSEIQGGLNREITITAEDGREIFHYEGKIDIETNHEGNANYILFEGEDGNRYIIYYGITDTMLIIEKTE